MKIRIGDNILVTTGKYRGKTGKVRRVFGDRNQVVVEKINIRTKHIAKRQGQAGQRIQYEAPFSSSNVMVLCPSCEKTTRVSYSRLESGAKQRICKKCNKSLDKVVERKQTRKR